jgi:hypothetical protein
MRPAGVRGKRGLVETLNDERVLEDRHLREIDLFRPVLIRVDRLVFARAFGDVHGRVSHEVGEVDEDLVELLGGLGEPVRAHVVKASDSLARVEAAWLLPLGLHGRDAELAHPVVDELVALW